MLSMDHLRPFVTTKPLNILRYIRRNMNSFHQNILLMKNGTVICSNCLISEYKLLYRSTLHYQKHDQLLDGWVVSTIFINWEDNNLYCVNCSKLIPSQYGEN